MQTDMLNKWDVLSTAMSQLARIYPAAQFMQRTLSALPLAQRRPTLGASSSSLSAFPRLGAPTPSTSNLGLGQTEVDSVASSQWLLWPETEPSNSAVWPGLGDLSAAVDLMKEYVVVFLLSAIRLTQYA